MKNIRMAMGLLFLMLSVSMAGKTASPLQVFFTMKQVFPELKEASIFISKEVFEAEKTKISRAALQTQIQAQVYPIESPKDISKHLRNMADESVLIVLAGGILDDKSSKLYILSKCKEKKIAIVTNSADYTESGATLGVVAGEDGKMAPVLNLKHSPHLKAKLSQAMLQKAGIAQVIE